MNQLYTKLSEQAELLSRLYETASSGLPWEAFLRVLASRFQAHAAQLIYHDTGSRALRFSAACGLDPDRMSNFVKLIDEDPRYPLNLGQPWHPGLVRDWHPEAVDDWRLRWHPDRPYTCRMLVPEDALHQSNFYRKILKPWGVEYTMGFCFRDVEECISLNLMRGPAQPPFDPAELEDFGCLVPSLRSAINLHRRLAKTDFERRCTTQLLDGVQFGIALADRQCRVHFMNRAANELCGQRDGLIFSNQSLLLTDPKQQRELETLVADVIATQGSSMERGVRILPVSRRSGRPDYTVMVSAMGAKLGAAASGLAQNAMALLLLSDPEQHAQQSQVMPWLYHLTRTETHVLSLLLEGLTVDAIGRRLHISDHTTRTHVKNLLRKTSTSRQADLIRVVMSSPAWVLSPILAAL